MQVVNSKKANPWQAPPVYHFETVYIQKEKINEEIDPQALVIRMKPSEELIKSGGSYISVTIHINEQKKEKVHFYIDKEGE